MQEQQQNQIAVEEAEEFSANRSDASLRFALGQIKRSPPYLANCKRQFIIIKSGAFDWHCAEGNAEPDPDTHRETQHATQAAARKQNLESHFLFFETLLFGKWQKLLCQASLSERM